MDLKCEVCNNVAKYSNVLNIIHLMYMKNVTSTWIDRFIHAVNKIINVNH